MRVGIVGYGVIGMATASVFPETVIYDPPKGYDDPQPLAECDVVFVCLPTPTKEGRQDLSIVKESLGELSSILPQGQVVALRSTVLPGTTRKLQEEFGSLHLASNPEFLRSHRAMQDTREPYRIVIGADLADARRAMLETYEDSLVVLSSDQIVLTDTLTAELIKYAANCYLATKISYFNEMYDICDAMGGNYGLLRMAVGLDPRIGCSAETIIDPHNRGFDDECLPKDLAAFITFLTEREFPATMFQGTQEVNETVRTGDPLEDVEL